MPKYTWITLNFAEHTPDDPEPDQGERIPLQIESDNPGVLYKGDQAFFKVRRGPDADPAVNSTAGTMTKTGTDLTETISGVLVFSDETEKRLPYARYTNLSYSFVGEQPTESPAIDKDIVSFNTTQTCVMEYEMEIFHDLWKLESDVEGVVEIMARTSAQMAAATVKFQPVPPVPPVEYGWKFEMELDSAQNPDNPVKGDDIYFKVRHKDGSTYTVDPTAGSTTQQSTDITEIYSGVLVFNDEKEKRLAYARYQNLSYSFVGDQPTESPAIDKDIVSFNTTQTCVMEYEMKIFHDLWKLESDVEGTVHIFGKEDTGKAANVSIVFGTEAPPPEFRDQTIEIRNSFNDVPVSGAQVWCDEFNPPTTLRGSTDSNGRITIPDLEVGKTYFIKFNASGYQPSELDILENDSFVAQ